MSNEYPHAVVPLEGSFGWIYFWFCTWMGLLFIARW